MGLIAMSRPLSWQRLRRSAAVRAQSEALCLAGITLVAGAIRIYGMTSKSIWYDEAFVITLAQMAIPDMVRGLIELDPHPPLYYLLMHFWTRLGTDPLLVRLPSVVFSTLSVPLLYVTGRRLAGRTVGLAAAVLLTFSSFHVEWAQEARMYTLLGLLCLGSTYFLARSLQGRGRLNWMAVSLLTAAALCTQLNAVFYLFAQGLAVLLLLVLRRLPRWMALPWLGSQMGAALLFLPWLPAMLVQNQIYGDPGLTPTTLRGIESLFFQLTYGHFPYWHLSSDHAVGIRDVLVLSSLLVAVLGAWSLRRGVSGTLLIALYLVTIGSLAAMGIWRSIALPKTVIGASFASILLVAAGLAAARRRTVLVAGMALLLLLSSLGLAKLYTAGSREDWREATGYLSRWLRPGEVVLADCGAGLMPLNYYLSLYGQEVEVHGVPFRSWSVSPPPLTADDLTRVDGIVSGRPGVWLVLYRNGFRDGDGQLLLYLSARYALADARILAKVRLFQFVPRRLETLPQLYFGAWVGERVNTPGDLDRFEEAIGKRLAIVHRYSDNPPYRGKRFDAEWATAVRDRGAIPMLSWQPGFGYGTRSLASVAAGERDDYIARWADELGDWGHPIFLRMMWEHNSPWFEWKAYQEPQVSEFVSAWRHIVELFRERGATNVTFVWSPHVSGYGASEIMPTYPGDDHVDWVALDGYPFRNGRGDFVEIFGPDYDLLASKISKPIMIAETSLESWSDELKAQWIRDILGRQIPTRFPKLRALVWFEEKNTHGADFSILQDQGPLSQAAFREEIASPLYVGNRFGELRTSPIPSPESLIGPVDGSPPVTAAARPRGEAPSVNLIADAGFEEGGAEGGWHPAWVIPTWVQGSVRRDSGAAASGGYSMLHSSGKGESYSVHQDVPVVAGATYQLSARVMVEAALRYGKATLEVQPLNQYGGTMETRVVANWSEQTQGWSDVKGSVKMPRGAAKARVQIRVTSLRGTFRLDDFSMMRSER